MAQKSGLNNSRRMSMETYMVRVYTGPLSQDIDFTSVEAEKVTPSSEIVGVAVQKLQLGKADKYELAEVFCSGGQLCKERRLDPNENPVRIQILWPRPNVDLAERDSAPLTEYRFYLRKKEDKQSNRTSSWVEYSEPNPVDSFLGTFLRQSSNKEYTDLCNLPDLNESTLMENLKYRFQQKNIYTYVGSILIAVNPFKFFPIYNPKYVKMYQNRRLGELPPHIFAVADAAFHTMLRDKGDQCIVISGESGSGKTESTNLLLHHLTALSTRKGLHGSGVEQTILGAGPVLEAFGNAKTVHNNNSSRFGKFIQVNYKENGMVHGAVVEQYLLEKSRIVSQARDERNYHVFYYLLAGASEFEQESLFLAEPETFYYLKQSDCYTLEGVDEVHEFERLKQSMEIVGFSTETQRRLFSVLSAVLHLGNIEFKKKSEHYHDEAVFITTMDTVKVISSLLKVKEETLVDALTMKRTVAGEETVIIPYKMEDAIATRDAMAKCLYGALFDWIVLQVNRALLAKKDMKEHQGNSIGVLDIFGFEDFNRNSFEQLCINYANEHLQYYFNQHIFKFEQEEYQREGIQWKNIEFIDNTGCLDLFAKKPHGLWHLLDEECNFPGASNETLLSKFHAAHKVKSATYYEAPQLKDSTFTILHYAGKVKYEIKDFREKNCDLMRPDIVSVLKNSSLAFVRELVGGDPVAVLHWAIVRAFFRSFFAFIDAGKRYRKPGGAKFKTLCRRHSAGRLSRLQRSESDSALSVPATHMSKELPPSLGSHSSSSMHAATLDRYRRVKPLDETPTVYGSVSPPSKDAPAGQQASAENFIYSANSKEMKKAAKVLMKNKSFKPKIKTVKGFRDLRSMKTLAGQTMRASRGASKKQPPSVSAQFQSSLSQLMETLSHAEPFFVRCIKSNSNKAPCEFDEDIIMRQLRYTGMLATVLIRQSGYNYRLTFEEFIQLYKILLPRGLVSSKADVIRFLKHMENSKGLSSENYQIGKTKVFFREREKLLLDQTLHEAIMSRIIKIQRWMKSILERRNFLRLKEAAITLQANARCILAQRQLQFLRVQLWATLCIQRWYRMVKERKLFLQKLDKVIHLQACCRGYLARQRYQILLEERRKEQQIAAEKARQKLAEDKHELDVHSSTSDEGILSARGSSNEELDKEEFHDQGHDSEGSSGYPEDSETESVDTFSERRSIPSTPTSPSVPRSPGEKDSLLGITWRHSLSKSQSADSIIQGLTRYPPIRSRKDKRFSAPLAKQESMSDPNMDPLTQIHRPSLPTLPNVGATRPTSLDPEAEYPVIHVEEESTEIEKTGDATSETDILSPEISISKKSPLKKAKHRIFNIMGGGKKKKDAHSDSDNSDTEDVRPQTHTLGMQTLPVKPSTGLQTPSPKSSPKLSKRIKQAWSSSEKEAGPHEAKLKKKRASEKRKRKKEEKEKEKEKTVDDKGGKWNVSGTSQWQYPSDLVVKTVEELQAMSTFIFNKIVELNKDCGRRDTVFDKVFKGALSEFHRTLITTTSVSMVDNSVSLKYKDLMSNFQQILLNGAREEGQDENMFPATLGINAFRGFLDEFQKEGKKGKADEKPDISRGWRKEKKKKEKEQVFEYLGHKFVTVQFSIPTFCEYCSKMMWMMEKGTYCQICKFTSHKKCGTKYRTPCKGLGGERDSPDATPGVIFGAHLSTLIPEGNKIPPVIERLITTIEIKGLYTEGVYRKSGSAVKTKQLIKALKSEAESIDFDGYHVHILTNVMKSFLRELPEPLLTFELYDDFIRIADLNEDKECIQALFAVIERLPKPNHDLLERLIFHLSRVAHHESSNKMSPNGLAIIFAPCILRTSKPLPAQDSLNHVPKQTKVVEYIITEQLKKLRTTLKDISTLESARVSADDRLSAVRASMRASKSRTSSTSTDLQKAVREDQKMKLEEKTLSAHIKSLQQEKENLTSNLPILEARNCSSDEDILDSGDDLESATDSMDDLDEVYDEYAVTFDLPGE